MSYLKPNFIFPFLFICVSFWVLSIAKSKKKYDIIAKNRGEEFAKKSTGFLKNGSYFLIIFSICWIVINLIFK